MRKLKAALKAFARNALRSLDQRLYAFDGTDLTAALRKLGVAPGDTILIHGAFGKFRGFQGGVSDAISAFQNAVGAEGTVLMPTIPFRTTAVAWAESGKVFDVRRTPSQMGLLSEVLRRTSGAVRSLHPTHAVTALGAGSREICADHHLSKTPCGAGTPYARLLERRGKILMAGVGIETMTFYHAIEELFEQEMPFSPFTQQTYPMPCRDEQGQEVVVVNRLFEPSLSKKRSMPRLEPYLRRISPERKVRVGGLDLRLEEATVMAEACRTMWREGRTVYDS